MIFSEVFGIIGEEVEEGVERVRTQIKIDRDKESRRKIKDSEGEGYYQ